MAIVVRNALYASLRILKTVPFRLGFASFGRVFFLTALFYDQRINDTAIPSCFAALFTLWPLSNLYNIRYQGTPVGL